MNSENFEYLIEELRKKDAEIARLNSQSKVIIQAVDVPQLRRLQEVTEGHKATIERLRASRDWLKGIALKKISECQRLKKEASLLRQEIERSKPKSHLPSDQFAYDYFIRCGLAYRIPVAKAEPVTFWNACDGKWVASRSYDHRGDFSGQIPINSDAAFKHISNPQFFDAR